MIYFKNISYSISHVFLMLFLYLFITHRYSKTKTMGICFGSFLMLSISDCLKLNIFPDSDVCYLLVTVFQILVTQSTGIFISKERNSRVLFMGLSASNYVIAGSIVPSILHIYTGDIIIALVGSFFVHSSILYILYSKIRNIWLEQYETEYVKSWWELCLIPVFFYCGFSCLAFFPHTLYDNPDNILGTLVFLLTMFTSYVVVLRYMESESKKKDIYWQNVLFESYIKGLEDQYYLVEQSEKNLKILRHDMRHYSEMINYLLSQGEYDEIKKITAYINDVADENKVVKYCSNLIVNTILSKMMERANHYQIAVDLDSQVPKELTINDYELSSVIANLFENTIICVKDFELEKRTIQIKIHCTQEHLLIQMKNEYKDPITLDSLTGLPKSKKGKNHGLGMQSVLAFSQKIGANTGCYCENGIFQILMFAKLNQ